MLNFPGPPKQLGKHQCRSLSSYAPLRLPLAFTVMGMKRTSPWLSKFVGVLVREDPADDFVELR